MEMQINTKRCHFSPVKLVQILKMLLPSVDKGVGKEALGHSVKGSVNWCSFFGRQCANTHYKLKILFMYEFGVFLQLKNRKPNS